MFASLPTRPRLALAFVAACLSAATAPAAPITFNFNTLSEGSVNASVQAYMQGVLTAAGQSGTVTVQNALGLKAYNGDGHVVGPGDGSVSRTLGSDGGAYIVNNGSDRITITFSFPVYAVGFDYEIFPDGTWSSSHPTVNVPDFAFAADGVTLLYKQGVYPGQFGTDAHSPFSGPIATEPVPQFLGSYSVNFYDQGKTKLEFIDWPKRIGIDNLTIDPVDPPPPPATPIPEPASIAVLAVLGTLGLVRWRRKSAPAAV